MMTAALLRCLDVVGIVCFLSFEARIVCGRQSRRNCTRVTVLPTSPVWLEKCRVSGQGGRSSLYSLGVQKGVYRVWVFNIPVIVMGTHSKDIGPLPKSYFGDGHTLTTPELFILFSMNPPHVHARS